MRHTLLFLFGLILPSFCTAQMLSFTDNIDSAHAVSQSDQKPLLIYMHAEWCTPCKFMEETTFHDYEVVNALNDDYVYTKLDVESPDGRLFAAIQGIQTVPAVVILDSDQSVRYQREGTQSIAQMIHLLSTYKRLHRPLPTSLPLVPSSSAGASSTTAFSAQ